MLLVTLCILLQGTHCIDLGSKGATVTPRRCVWTDSPPILAAGLAAFSSHNTYVVSVPDSYRPECSPL